MKLFTELYWRLDESNRTSEKVAALEHYFRTAPPEDAMWALAFLTGNRPGRAVNTRLLREWVSETSDIPLWLVEECYDAVGDLSETIALLLPERVEGTDVPLHRLVEETVLALKGLSESEQRERVREVWSQLNSAERFVWHKMLGGGFRVGVSRTLVVRALANVCGLEPAEMAHRLMGKWAPTAEEFARITGGAEAKSDHARPYPFCLAHALEGSVDSLGDPAEWMAEWKWDGIRAQVIHRAGEVLAWSRGEEMIHERFPEVALIGARLPNGTVLDGEVLAWRDEAPLPFAVLQTRIGRKTVGKKVLAEAPATFVAYDLLEWKGEDLREKPLEERRALLEQLAADTPGLRISPLVRFAGWGELAAERDSARERGVEGLMLKRRSSIYRVGRVKGDWWKWKVDPLSVDAVMVYAQRGSGRRASLFTDYTFAVWNGEGELVPFAKAYSGLTDAEIRKVDDWIRRNTVEKHGPVRVVRPELVFEIAFEGIQRSKRHKSGIAVRFPRIARWRLDKGPGDADTLEQVQALLGPTADE